MRRLPHILSRWREPGILSRALEENMRPDLPTDLAELLDLLRGSADVDAANLLVEWLPRLRAMVRRHLPAHSVLRVGLDSEDLLQEGLLQIVRQVESFRGNSWPEFLGFVHSVLRQKTQEQARRQGVRRGELHRGEDANCLASQRPSPSMDAAGREEVRRLTELVDSLPEPYRSCLQYRLDGLDNASIARRLRVAEHTVRQRLSRAVKLLQGRW